MRRAARPPRSSHPIDVRARGSLAKSCSVDGCLALVLIHSYWLLGHRVLGLREQPNPTAVTHVTLVDFGPACSLIASASHAIACRSALCVLDGARWLVELDEAVHDAFLDLLDARPSAIFLSLARGRARSTRVGSSGITGSAPHEIVSSPVRQCSAPIVAPARVLIATSARRNAAKRSRHLQNGQRSIGFVVDSGCTWRIHPYVSDLVNIRDCDDLVAGTDGRPQRCVAIGDFPLTALNDSGQDIAITVRDVRCAPSFSDSLLSVSALWESSGTECCFADVKAIISPPTPQGKRLVLPFKPAGGLYELRVTTRGRQTVEPDARSTRSRCLAIHASRTHHH
eukprot:6174016-Pleurochrysis_carterae.AAC.1